MFGKNIKYLRTKNKMRQVDLSSKLGYSTWTTINKWETDGVIPPFKTLVKIAGLFGVSEDDLLHTDLEKKDLGELSTTEGDTVRIKVFGSIPAGVPQEAIEDVTDFEDIPKELTAGGREYFGLKVHGESMTPKYLNNDTVIVRKCSTCESGDDCVVYVNGFNATLKRVIKSADKIILQPLNPAFEPAVFIGEDINTVKIAGVVVEIRRKV